MAEDEPVVYEPLTPDQTELLRDLPEPWRFVGIERREAEFQSPGRGRVDGYWALAKHPNGPEVAAFTDSVEASIAGMIYEAGHPPPPVGPPTVEPDEPQA